MRTPAPRHARRRGAGALLCLAALGLAGCFTPPESTVALSEPGGTPYDERLIGEWFARYDGGETYLSIEPTAEPALLEGYAMSVSPDRRPPVRWIIATIHASSLDGRIYYNIRRTAGVGDDYGTTAEPPHNIIVDVEFPPGRDTMRLCFMSTNAIRAGIADLPRMSLRTVKSEYHGAGFEYRVLEGPRDGLAALIRKAAPGQLFHDCIELERIAAGPAE